VIDAPGVYDLDAATYFADPCPTPSLSASIAAVLISKTPMHAAFLHKRLNPDFEESDDSKFDFGNAMHAALLGGARLAVIPFDSYRSKAAQEARDGAWARRSVPVLPEQLERVQAACRAVWRHLSEHRECSEALSKGRPEQTLIAREGRVWIRVKLDWLPELTVPGKKRLAFYDLKTTTDANPDVWTRRLFEIGADVQSALYRRVIRTVLGIENPIFRFVVAEAKPPHGVSVVELDPAAVDLADRKVETAIRIWDRCLEAGKWPGYPPVVHHVAAPAWQQQKFEDRVLRKQTLEELGVEYFGL